MLSNANKSRHASLILNFADIRALSSKSKTVTLEPLLKNKAVQLAPIVPAPSTVINVSSKALAHRSDKFAFKDLEYAFKVMTTF